MSFYTDSRNIEIVCTDMATGKQISNITIYEDSVVSCIGEVIDMIRSGKLPKTTDAQLTDIDLGEKVGWCHWNLDTDIEEYGYYN